MTGTWDLQTLTGTTHGFSRQWCVCAVVATGDGQWTGEALRWQGRAVKGGCCADCRGGRHERSCSGGIRSAGSTRGGGLAVMAFGVTSEETGKLRDLVELVNCESLY